MQKTKKILSIILAIIMIATTIPFAFAAETPIAKIGDIEYTDFDEALANWVDGTTLVLLADTPEYANNIEIKDKTVVLDLNGHTLQLSTTESKNIEILENGDLTILDNIGTGEVNSCHASAYISGGALTIEGGTLIGTIFIWGGTLTMTGGKVEGYSSLTDSNTQAIHGDGTFNFYGGTLKGRYAVWDFSDAIVNFSGTIVVEATDNICSGQGTTTITGGTFSHDPTNYVVEGCDVITNDNGTFTVLCNHIGGEATCTTKAVCDLCGEEYGDINANNHNFVNGTCLYCRNNKNIIGALSPQIRFQRNVDGSYADKFDVRTRASISDEDFTALVGATNSEATQNIKKVGFVYSINPDTFSIEDAKTVAMGSEIAGYTDAPVKYIQDADGYYMFTCLVTDIPSTDTNYTLVSYAYICVEDADGNEKWYFMETQAEADFNSLYATYYPVACEKYGW